MAIDFKNESPITLSVAARLLPPNRRGRPVSLSCVLRWVIDGVRTPAGKIVRLEATRLGGRWLTSHEALQRFADAQTPRFESESITPPRTAAKRQRASERAAAELTKSGI